MQLSTRDRNALLGILITAAGLRLPLLDRFPIYEADEGLWTISSKNLVAFGDWFMDGRTHFLLSPVFHLLSITLFALAGPSVPAARMVSAVAGVVSVLVLFLLTRRLTGQTRLALIAALLLALSGWGVELSRRALIESLEVCLALVAFYGASIPSRGGRLLAAASMALCLLTKSNALFLLPALCGFAYWSSAGTILPSITTRLVRAGIVAIGALGIAGLGYAMLYYLYPTQFIHAFRFELAGTQFTANSHPIVRVGRFGLDIELTARAILGVIREDPFLLVLSLLGVGGAVCRRMTLAEYAFGFWLATCGIVTALQIFQPARYYFLIGPALAFWGAVATCALADGIEATTSPQGRRHMSALAGLIAVIAAFEVSYTGINLLVTKTQPSAVVSNWARSTPARTDAILAAAYFCTDMENRCYAYYQFARDSTQLLTTLTDYHISYVVYDQAQWPAWAGTFLQAHFPVAETWSFGSAYDVRPSPH